MNKRLFILLLFAVIGLTSWTTNPKFSWKNYGNVYNYFENRNDMVSFFNFHKGDIVAEVGAASGENMCGFNFLADSVTFYVQDIDTTYLNKKNLDKVIRRCNRHKKPQTNQFKLCIGTEKSTNLPDNTFDKIFLIETLHELKFMDEMMTDIYKKLRPGGQLYICEAHCLSHKTNYTGDETVEMLKKYNFVLVKKDGRDLHRSSDLFRAVFRKK